MVLFASSKTICILSALCTTNMSKDNHRNPRTPNNKIWIGCISCFYNTFLCKQIILFACYIYSNFWNLRVEGGKQLLSQVILSKIVRNRLFEFNITVNILKNKICKTKKELLIVVMVVKFWWLWFSNSTFASHSKGATALYVSSEVYGISENKFWVRDFVGY